MDQLRMKWEDVIFIQDLINNEQNYHLNKTIDKLHYFVGLCNDINYIELLSVYASIKHIKSHYINYLKLRRYLYLITDNQQTFHWLSGDDNINEKYIYDIVKKVYIDIFSLKVQ